MAIHPEQPRIDPSDQVIGADDIPNHFGPYRDNEKELARERQRQADEKAARLSAENAQLKAAEAKRRKLTTYVGGSVAGLLLVGGVFAGTKFAGGESEPGPEPTEPGVAGPETPGEVVEEPETVPGETGVGEQPTGEVEPSVDAISIENLRDFSNDEIREWFTLEEEKITSLRQAGAHEFVFEHGATGPQEFDPEPWIAAFEASPDGMYPMTAASEDPNNLNTVELFPQLNANLTAYAATLHHNDWLRVPEDRNPPAVAVHRAFGETFLADSYSEMGLATATRVPTDNEIVIGLMETVETLPEDVVITDVSVDLVKITQGPESGDNGTSALISYRHDDGTDGVIEWKVTDMPPAPYVVSTNGVLQGWDKYANEDQSAMMMFR